MKKLDIYITKKFLGTFFLALLLIICITIVFDLAEHLDEFINSDVSTNEIIFDYYLNFIPYFANLYSSLFVFIAVIFFTSKMSSNSEIVAILSSGISYLRLAAPYAFSALLIGLFSFTLNSFIIPHANTTRLEFTNNYLRNPYANNDRNIHKQVRPGTFVYIQHYNNKQNIGYKFSLEKYDLESKKLVSKLMSDYAKWDSTKNKWTVKNYYIRNFDSINEEIIDGIGKSIDTSIYIKPSDFGRKQKFEETMTTPQLVNYIKDLKLQGADDIKTYYIEKHKRIAFPFSAFVLTIIGFTLSSKKVKGGMGLHLGLGIVISFAYILFMQFSSQFSIKGDLDPFIAVWIPNILFGIIAIILYRTAQK